jgi:FMN reductase (NADPH)
VDSKITFFNSKLSDFQKRYGQEIPDNTYPTNEFVENIIKRKTVRNFTDQKIDPALLEKLFAAAQSAPTGCMFQPWSVVITKTKEAKLKIIFDQTTNENKVGPLNLGAIIESDIFIVWCADLNMINNVLTNVSNTSILDFTNTSKILSAKESFDYSMNEIPAMWDTVIAAQTFCLAAESVGLGVMYCGAIKNIDLTEHFNLPNKVVPLFGMCVGYPKENLNLVGENIAIKPRLPQKLIVHIEKYLTHPFEEFIKYNDLMSKFYNFYLMEGNWFTRIIDRGILSKNGKFYKNLLNKYGFWLR